MKKLFSFSKKSKVIPTPVAAEDACYRGRRVGEGIRQGWGEYRFVTGDVYDGEWDMNAKHGFGEVNYASGSRYVGYWKHDTKSGFGYFLHGNDGSSYCGQWVADKRNGQGVALFGAGGAYEGDWVNDEIQGVGRFVYASGEVYDGEWVGSKKHGVGSWVAASRMTSYSGGWVSDMRHGIGIIVEGPVDDFPPVGAPASAVRSLYVVEYDRGVLLRRALAVPCLAFPAPISTVYPAQPPVPCRPSLLPGAIAPPSVPLPYGPSSSFMSEPSGSETRRSNAPSSRGGSVSPDVPDVPATPGPAAASGAAPALAAPCSASRPPVPPQHRRRAAQPIPPAALECLDRDERTPPPSLPPAAARGAWGVIADASAVVPSAEASAVAASAQGSSAAAAGSFFTSPPRPRAAQDLRDVIADSTAAGSASGPRRGSLFDHFKLPSAPPPPPPPQQRTRPPSAVSVAASSVGPAAEGSDSDAGGSRRPSIGWPRADAERDAETATATATATAARGVGAVERLCDSTTAVLVLEDFD